MFQTILRKGLSKMARGGAAVAVLAMCAPLAAEPVLIEAAHNRNGSSFVLTFPALDVPGTPEHEGRVPAEISRTEFSLVLDALDGTARFEEYFQTVDALNVFGVDTGPLEITIVDSQPGEFRADRTFSTVDTYEIRYFKDLSELGLPPEDENNPDLGGVYPMTSTSNGSISIPDFEGISTLSWVGSDSLATPFGSFDFDYTCSMLTVFAATPSNYLTVELIPLVTNTSMSDSLRASLNSFLNTAATAFSVPNSFTGVRALNRFIQAVQRASAAHIVAADGQLLIQAATRAIQLTTNPPQTWPMRTQPIRGDKWTKRTTD